MTEKTATDSRKLKYKTYFSNQKFPIPKFNPLYIAVISNRHDSEPKEKKRHVCPYYSLISQTKSTPNSDSAGEKNTPETINKPDCSASNEKQREVTKVSKEKIPFSSDSMVSGEWSEWLLEPSQLDNKNSNNRAEATDQNNLKKNISFCTDDMVSQWSEWYLEPSPPKNPFERVNKSSLMHSSQRLYSFLPAQLGKLLPINTTKLVDQNHTRVFNINFSNLNINHSQQQFNHDVRPCGRAKKIREIAIEKKSLRRMEILSQVNQEFIAATTVQNGEKIIILIDQHAMDERIRYESLLRDYKNERGEFFSTPLQHPLLIEGIHDEVVSILTINSARLTDFGIRLMRDSSTSCIVTTIPTCFTVKKYAIDARYLTEVVKALLLELAEKITNYTILRCLPLTIHNAIASEACHSAIRFGDPLNRGECKILLDYWRKTDLPNRCAHGRPAVIPLMSINLRGSTMFNEKPEKLNFRRLKEYVLKAK